MKRTLILSISALLLWSGAALSQTCVQDQYGNQYTVTIDKINKYLYGTGDIVQCVDPVWVVIGSYYKGRVELTAVNPSGDNDPGCVNQFKLKGDYPNFAWYYDFGYGSQESAYVPCGSSAIIGNPGEGALR